MVEGFLFTKEISVKKLETVERKILDLFDKYEVNLLEANGILNDLKTTIKYINDNKGDF